MLHPLGTMVVTVAAVVGMDLVTHENQGNLGVSTAAMLPTVKALRHHRMAMLPLVVVTGIEVFVCVTALLLSPNLWFFMMVGVLHVVMAAKGTRPRWRS